MAIQILIQKDYFLTEASIKLPSDPAELDELLRAIKTTGKMVRQYNQGSVQGINIEQRTKIPESIASEIRRLLQIGETIL